MDKELIFITGYFGAPIRKTAEAISDAKGCRLLFIDDEIEKSDGRSVLRICMAMGEHEYRNKEYEILSRIVSDFEAGSLKSTVVCCGDGILNDEMSKDLIKKHTLIIAGEDMSTEELWKNAASDIHSCHAFMHFGTEESRKNAFVRLYERQRHLFSSVI